MQKSLKHEIWSSTVLGNRRLNNAFKESADKGPIYLFFSVNGSRHFCGVAEMLTEYVDFVPLIPKDAACERITADIQGG